MINLTILIHQLLVGSLLVQWSNCHPFIGCYIRGENVLILTPTPSSIPVLDQFISFHLLVFLLHYKLKLEAETLAHTHITQGLPLQKTFTFTSYFFGKCFIKPFAATTKEVTSAVHNFVCFGVLKMWGVYTVICIHNFHIMNIT